MRVLTLIWVTLLLMASTIRGDEQWPEFRGPRGDGSSRATDLPLHWSESENIAWKAEIHDRGWSSPVIWNDQIWVTTSTSDGHKLFALCIDRQSGKVVHDLHLFDVEKPEFVAPSNSYASPTSAIEEGRVYLHFGTNGTACVDTATGKTTWTRRDLNCNHEQGAGSSPILAGDYLIVNVDGRDVQYVIALDKRTAEMPGKQIVRLIIPATKNSSAKRIRSRQSFLTGEGLRWSAPVPKG